jgi:predicted alpha/beta superfamily hydrolase
MKIVLASVCLLFMSVQSASAQMTLQVTSVPQLTPLFDEIYVAGNFNDWNPGDPAYLLQPNNGIYSISINAQPGELLEFKFTRGSWNTVEGTATGGYMSNRNSAYTSGETFSYEIAGWEDIPGNHSVTPHVRILDSDMYIPQLDRNRRVWICLPEDYETSTAHYPVIYLHDAQNVFDQATSFAGEWGCDESMLQSPLSNCVNAILVGVDNGGLSRIDEYAPWINAEYNEGGEGAAFASFMAQTLKPFIDANFRTQPEREHTFMIGSSLGALITMYTVIEFNDVFSGGAIFSPAFWFNQEVYDYVENNAPSSGSKFYFICGDSESSGLVSETQQMHNIITAAGITGSENVFNIQSGGAHNEYWWSNYFPGAVQSLISCNTAITSPADNTMLLFPNPANDSVMIRLPAANILLVELCDSNGSKLHTIKQNNLSGIDISHLPAGLYHLCIHYQEEDGKKKQTTASFIKK